MNTDKPKLLAFAGDAGGWLTPTEAAPYLSLHPRTVRDMCADGRITTYRQGTRKQARYKIHRDVIAAWVDRRTNHAKGV